MLFRRISHLYVQANHHQPSPKRRNERISYGCLRWLFLMAVQRTSSVLFCEASTRISRKSKIARQRRSGAGVACASARERSEDGKTIKIRPPCRRHLAIIALRQNKFGVRDWSVKVARGRQVASYDREVQPSCSIRAYPVHIVYEVLHTCYLHALSLQFLDYLYSLYEYLQRNQPFHSGTTSYYSSRSSLVFGISDHSVMGT